MLGLHESNRQTIKVSPMYIYLYMTLCWADVIAIVTTLGQFLLFAGSSIIMIMKLPRTNLTLNVLHFYY